MKRKREAIKSLSKTIANDCVRKGLLEEDLSDVWALFEFDVEVVEDRLGLELTKSDLELLKFEFNSEVVSLCQKKANTEEGT